MPDWKDLAPLLADRSREELLALVAELCRSSADNRRFVAARLGGRDADESGAEVLEEYRRRIRQEFASEPARAPRLGVARKAIRDYRKATEDLEGAADLMLTYVEEGTRFSREHGDMSEAYYGSLGQVLRDLANLLRREPELRQARLPRLAALAEASRRVGWTWGGFVAEVVAELERGAAAD
jgi:hypothetical protein